MSQTFARLFGPRWRDQGSDPHTLEVWLRALELARVEPHQVRAGLAKAAMLTWPPTAGEFVALCKPPLPSLLSAYAEAVRWARDPAAFGVTWSHDVVGAAARQCGDFRLRQLTEDQGRRLFADTLREMIARHDRGEDLAPAVQPKLEHEISAPGFRVPRMTAEEAMADLRRSLGLGSAA